ncbi:MAG: translation initiation factor [Flavobacteriales bacterium]|nr:translation initiation factor [Flavobacteriales bacterium]
MAKSNLTGFEALGGLVFSTDREMDLSIPEEQTQTLPTEKQHLSVKKDTFARKGKVVTVVDGFVGKQQDLESLGKEVKKYCAVGGSVKDNQIIIQGEFVQKVKDFLLKKGFKHIK